MSSGLEEDLTCAVCCEIYEENTHEPVLLPQCGHSFCRPCLLQIENNNSSLLCPNCRTPHHGPSISEMPTVYALLSVSRKAKSELQGHCRFHGKPMKLWCRECCMEMCESCYSRQKKEKRKCTVVDIEVVIQENKEEILEKVKHIKLQIDKEKESLYEKMYAIAKEIMDIFKKSKVLNEFINEVDEKEKVTRTAQELFILKKVLCDIKSIYSQVSETTKNMRQEENLSQATAQQELISSETDTEDRMMNNGMIAKGFTAIAKELSQFILNDLKTEELPTTWKINRLEIDSYVTWPKLPWKNIINQLPLVQLFVPLEVPEVYFHLIVGEISLGWIKIRLWGHMVRAQQFLALCLGTFGPTYKGSSFKCVENTTGRFLIGGYYNTNKGTTSAHGMMRDLEWDGKYKQDTRKGLIGGWSYQKPELEATFGFACGNSFSGHLLCPFGEVISGMTVLDDVSLREDVTEVIIADCGFITS